MLLPGKGVLHYRHDTTYARVDISISTFCTTLHPIPPVERYVLHELRYVVYYYKRMCINPVYSVQGYVYIT